MFLVLFIFILLAAGKCKEVPKVPKPYLVLPFPLELPNRNDRSEQCWLRIEDVELTETLTVYCHMAQGFLHNFIHDYNSRKIMEDGVDVSLWYEDPRPLEKVVIPNKNKSSVIDWKLTTVMDPVTNRRMYVTRNADCKLIMYSREGMTSYDVQCDKILYYLNVRMSNSSSYTKCINVVVIAIIVLLYNKV